jgi:hypothetical protein
LNLIDSVLAFKVSLLRSSYSAQAYSVKPNLGLLMPEHPLTITITKQSIGQCHVLTRKLKEQDEVVIQTEGLNLAAMWQYPELLDLNRIESSHILQIALLRRRGKTQL